MPLERKRQIQFRFTLIELLVTIAAIAILLPAIGAARENALKAKNRSNLRQLHSFTMQYSNDHGGIFPLAKKTKTNDSNDNLFLILQDEGHLQLQNIKK